MKPKNVVAVYDAPQFADRYTVVTNEPVGDGRVYALALSDNCNQPNGFSQWVYVTKGEHFGARVAWGSLPDKVRDHAAARLAD